MQSWSVMETLFSQPDALASLQRQWPSIDEAIDVAGRGAQNAVSWTIPYYRLSVQRALS